jgi:hypothetical protein
VDFPTEGKPTRPTLASPLLVTSKPWPAPPPPFADGSRSSLRSFASFAYNYHIANAAEWVISYKIIHLIIS